MARPRSARAHKQVLDVAEKLFSERGVDATSMDAIAEKSGVSKATIYKHWPDKEALCLEVLGRLREFPVFESGDVRADITALLGHQPCERGAAIRQRLMPHLVAHAARHPEFAKAWKKRMLKPPRAQLTRLLRRAVAEEKLSPKLDIGLGVALLIGPVMYHRILNPLSTRLPGGLPERVVDSFWRAHALNR